MSGVSVKDDTAASGEVQLLLHYMPIVVRAPGLSDWERGFCASIIARRRKGSTRWSLAQIAVMRCLVDWFRVQNRDDDAVIEGGPDRG